MVVDDDTGRHRVPFPHRPRHAMGGFFEVTPVLRLLAIRHQANDLKAVVGRAGILQAGGNGHGWLVGTGQIIT